MKIILKKIMEIKADMTKMIMIMKKIIIMIVKRQTKKKR